MRNILEGCQARTQIKDLKDFMFFPSLYVTIIVRIELWLEGIIENVWTQKLIRKIFENHQPFKEFCLKLESITLIISVILKI